MKRFHFLIFIVVSILLISCNATITKNITKSYPVTSYDEEMTLYDLDEIIPYEYDVIGTAKAGDSGFSLNCGYDFVVDQLMSEARKAGGNAIRIIYHKRPDVWSSCHRIKVEIIRVKY